MIKVLSGVWALLLGIVLIMLGNGMHFTLVGLRGGMWRHRGIFIDRIGDCHLRLFSKLPVRRTAHPIDDTAGRSCACFCCSRKLHVGWTDCLAALDRALDLDGPEGDHQVLNVGNLCCG